VEVAGGNWGGGGEIQANARIGRPWQGSVDLQGKTRGNWTQLLRTEGGPEKKIVPTKGRTPTEENVRNSKTGFLFGDDAVEGAMRAAENRAKHQDKGSRTPRRLIKEGGKKSKMGVSWLVGRIFQNICHGGNQILGWVGRGESRVV